MAFSPDGSSLATASRGLGNRVGLWDARTGRPVRSLDSAGDPVPALAFARDGRLVAGTASRVRAWDGRTGKPVGEPAAVPHGIDRVAVCPDGRRVVVATPGVYICALGKPRAGDPDIPFEKTLTGFALSPDGRLLATADGGPVVRLWEVLTGAEAAAVPFRDPVHGLALGPGGRTLAAATAGGTVLYDLPTAAARLTLRGATADTLVAFSADGRRLATAGSAESTAMVWDVADVREPPAVRRDPLGRDGLQECWEALAAPDPKLGSAAAWKLAASPAEAVPFLARALGTPLPDAARIARWIADLDHARYAVRERAARAGGRRRPGRRCPARGPEGEGVGRAGRADRRAAGQARRAEAGPGPPAGIAGRCRPRTGRLAGGPGRLARCCHRAGGGAADAGGQGHAGAVEVTGGAGYLSFRASGSGTSTRRTLSTAYSPGGQNGSSRMRQNFTSGVTEVGRKTFSFRENVCQSLDPPTVNCPR